MYMTTNMVFCQLYTYVYIHFNVVLYNNYSTSSIDIVNVWIYFTWSPLCHLDVISNIIYFINCDTLHLLSLKKWIGLNVLKINSLLNVAKTVCFSLVLHP